VVWEFGEMLEIAVVGVGMGLISKWGLGLELGVLELGAVVETGACVGVGRWVLL